MSEQQFSLGDLEARIAERAGVTDGSSWTAKLVAGRMEKAARKMGEEAVETIVAALAQDETATRDEAADLLYHLLVVLHLKGVRVGDVLGELQRRTASSGVAEKAARSVGDGRPDGPA